MNNNLNRSDILIKSVMVIAKKLILITIAVVFATIFLALSKYDPMAIIKGLYESLTADIAGTIRWSIPLILSGLAICICYKAEVFNLGVDGQIYMGAAAATYVALKIPSSAGNFSSMIMVFSAAMLAGALFALIPALMKVCLNVNEVVSTLLLNFVAELYVEFLVNGALRDKESGINLNASAVLPENTWLKHITALEPSSANIGIYIAIIATLIMAFIFLKTRFGHEIKMVGANPEFARYSGIKSNRTIISVMCTSGAIGGMIGTIEVTAIQHRLLSSFNPGFGFEGIVVSLLANNNPFGVIFSGTFFGALKNGGINMERLTDVPSAVTNIVVAVIILSISAQFAFKKLKKRKTMRKQNCGEGKIV